MKKILLLCAGLIFITSACTPSLSIKPDGTMEAFDYVVMVRPDGGKQFIPKPSWSSKAIEGILKSFSPLVQ